MAENLLPISLESAKLSENQPPVVVQRKLYFINEIVEWLLTKYLWTGCTNVDLRDSIMSHASELIRQIIRRQRLHTIYPGQEDSAFGDLLQTAWCQIERVLYKYRSRPHCRACFNPDRPSESLLYNPPDSEYGIKTINEVLAMLDRKRCPYCGVNLEPQYDIEPVQGIYGGTNTILFRGMSKVFNMWSQVARTVILAHIKKEGRDRKNASSYMNHVGSKSRPPSGIVTRFIDELRDLWQYNTEYLLIVSAIENLFKTDPKPYDGVISKLVAKTRLPRSTITIFITLTRLRSLELTDSNISRIRSDVKVDKRRFNEQEDD